MKVRMQINFTAGDSIVVEADPNWLREFVMANQWCSIGSEEDEIWINGAHVITVNRVKM